MITYKEACDFVSSAQKFGISLGLERMELMLEELGNPHLQLPAIHIAGTNGKGSTLTYLAAIFREAGYNVGTFTSPAILRVNDKIKVNGIDIGDSDFAQIVFKLQPIIVKIASTSSGPPTEFEILTAIAFEYFSNVNKPDIVIFETGLGGRLDSTNITKPLVSIITNIGHDHMDILGDTIGKIAAEKAGIIKEGIPVVSGCKQEEAIKVVTQKSIEQHASLFQLDQQFRCIHKNISFDFISEKNTFSDLTTGMFGKHQQENATLALMAIELLPNFSISETAIRNGLKKAKIANRIEVVQENPAIIFDGGHNPEGMQALATTLSTNFSEKNIYVLFCAMKDKDIKKMVEPLKDLVTQLIFTSFPYERAMDPQQAFEQCQLTNSEVIEDWFEAYKHIEKQLQQDDIFVITGSLYFLNEVRNRLEK